MCLVSSFFPSLFFKPRAVWQLCHFPWAVGSVGEGDRKTSTPLSSSRRLLFSQVDFSILLFLALWQSLCIHCFCCDNVFSFKKDLIVPQLQRAWADSRCLREEGAIFPVHGPWSIVGVNALRSSDPVHFHQVSQTFTCFVCSSVLGCMISYCYLLQHLLCTETWWSAQWSHESLGVVKRNIDIVNQVCLPHRYCHLSSVLVGRHPISTLLIHTLQEMDVFL